MVAADLHRRLRIKAFDLLSSVFLQDMAMQPKSRRSAKARSRICAAFGSLVPQLLFAASSTISMPPPGSPDIQNLPSTLSAAVNSKVFLGAKVVELERTTLVDIQKVAGVGSIRHRGDAGESESWLCYTSSLDGKVAHIWLSSGELGGPERAVGSVVVEAAYGIHATVDCPELPKRLAPISLGVAVRFDMRLNRLKSQLGEPSQQKGDWWLYSYSGKVQSGSFDRFSVFGVRIVDGKIVAFFLSQTTTN
jgi:hypothetical protein